MPGRSRPKDASFRLGAACRSSTPCCMTWPRYVYAGNRPAIRNPRGSLRSHLRMTAIVDARVAVEWRPPDVHGDRRRHVAACAPVLHHAGDRGQANVERVRKVAADIGARLKALKPDLSIIFSNDHAEQFFHNVCPAFTVQSAARPRASSPAAKFTGRFRADRLELVRNSVGRASIQPSPRPRGSTMPSASRSPTSAHRPGAADLVNAYPPPQPTALQALLRVGARSLAHGDAARPEVP